MGWGEEGLHLFIFMSLVGSMRVFGTHKTHTHTQPDLRLILRRVPPRDCTVKLCRAAPMQPIRRITFLGSI